MFESMRTYLNASAGLAVAGLALALDGAQGAVARTTPAFSLLDQAQIGALGLIAINVCSDQVFTDDTGGDSGQSEAEVAAPGAPTEDSSGDEVLDQAQVAAMGLFALNIGSRQRFVDDRGGEDVAMLREQIVQLQEQVARLEALVKPAKRAAAKKPG